MSAIPWETDLVERPFCEQLRGLGWQWIEGDTQVPEFTERGNFREVWLRGRLADALRGGSTCAMASRGWMTRGSKRR